MKLKIEKPIVFFDIESTGKNVEKDQIVEICVTKIFPDGRRDTTTRRIKPTIPIPPAATEIHGITDADVAASPSFRSVAHSLYDLIVGCALFGYHLKNFDVPMLFHEFARAGIIWKLEGISIVDVCVIFKRNESRNLQNAYRFYCSKEMTGMHGAEADVHATIDVFMAQIERYPDLPNDLRSLDFYTSYDKGKCDVISRKFSKNIDGDYIIEFGSHKGERAIDNLDFINWMTRCISPPFANDTLDICFKILDAASPHFNQDK